MKKRGDNMVVQKIREEIMKRGMTLTHLSKETAIPLDALSKTFLGKRRLQADELVKICKAMNIDLDFFENVSA